VTVQQAIVRRAGELAYAPTRLPVGYRFVRWSYARSPQPVLRIRFTNRGRLELTFAATRQRGDCAAGKQKTFQLAGNRVYWAQAASGQRAWRCVAGTRLETTTAFPPTRFSDSGLGAVSSSAHRLR
jgi:hypothetical protein